MTPPLPSPPRTQPLPSSRRRRWPRRPSCGMTFTRRGCCHVVDHPRRREVRRHGPLARGEHVSGRKRQRVFLAEVPARLVDYRQPVGVGVLREANVHCRLGRTVAELLQMLESRLRIVREKPVGRAVLILVTSQPSASSICGVITEPAPLQLSRATLNFFDLMSFTSTLSSILSMWMSHASWLTSTSLRPDQSTAVKSLRNRCRGACGPRPPRGISRRRP